ncbi:hypothetical protein BKA93DRAFT_744342 [Sparassis latifolia]
MGCVIQRLFELHNLNILQTAYCVHTHIAKSLQNCSKAIRTSLNAYNAAAAALDPPRPALDWSRVTHYSFLEEFTLLRDTCNDIREKQWSKPAVREAMKCLHCIARAHEEITRCNIETHRLHTSILNENVHLATVISQLNRNGDILHSIVNDYYTWHQ